MMTLSAVLMLVTLATISVRLSPAAAQVKYTDRAGKSHWVQSEAQVPEEYRAERPHLPGTGSGSEAGACNSGDPKRDASCNRAEWRSAMTKLCYVYGANTDDCREFRRMNAQRNVRDMMRR